MIDCANEKQRQWFRAAKLGLFVHWGLYSLLGRGEWVLKRDGIPFDEYTALAQQFNPRSFSPESWCLAAKRAGMKYVVFTAVHHDGFALFDSQADPFNSVNSPVRRDFVAEFVAACRKYDLGAGLYFSLVDWRFTMENSDPAAPEKMKLLMHERARELMSKYGKIDILWYDGLWCPSKGKPTREEKVAYMESERLNTMVREFQPGILINDRSGMDQDFATIEGKNIIRRPEGATLWEACMTLGDDDFSYWGYCRNAINRRTPLQTLLLVLHTLEHGGNIMLNVGPDADGIIPAWQTEILDYVGSWVENNAEAVYGIEATEVSRPTPISHQGNSCGFFTAKGEALYFYLYEWPGEQIRIPLMRKDIRSVSVLKTGQELCFRRDELGALIISGLPSTSIDPAYLVLKLLS